MNDSLYVNFDEIPVEEHCRVAIANVHAFLSGELPESSADQIRTHLMACESCMDNFDVEHYISTIIKRSHSPVTAPASLHMAIRAMQLRASLDSSE